MAVGQGQVTFDELRALLRRLNDTPVPHHVHDRKGIAQQALDRREALTRREWYQEFNDEVLY